jgi:hypothetical protein
MEFRLARARRLGAAGLSLLLLGALLALLAPHTPTGTPPSSPPLAQLEKAALGWASPRTAPVFDPDGDDMYPIYRVPALASLGGPTLLAIAEARVRPEDHSPTDLVVKRSYDRGLSWSAEVTIIVNNHFGVPGADSSSRGYTSYGNPTPISLAPSPGAASDEGGGSLLLLFTVNETWVYQTATTDGRKWTNPVNVSEQVKLPGWGRVVTGPGHGLELAHGEHRGRLVVPFNHMLFASHVTQTQTWTTDPTDARNVRTVQTDYELDNPSAGPVHHGMPLHRGHIPLHHFAAREHDEGRVVDVDVGVGVGGLGPMEARACFAAALYSDDRGKTWHASSEIPALGSHEHMIAELPSGELVSSFRTYNGRGAQCRRLAFSGDAGITWQLREQATGADGSCAMLGLQREGSIAAVGRWLYAAGPYEPLDERRSLRLYASSDKGVHWQQLGARPAGAELAAGYSDLVAWPASGVEPWPEVGILYEHGPKASSAISFTRAELNVE